MTAADALRFNGRIAVITGAGTGLGRAHAIMLAKRGAAVVVNDLDAAAATAVVDEIVATGGRAVAHVGDVSVESGADSLLRTALGDFGRVDIVINNAGLLRTAEFAEMTAELWDRVVGVNLRATFLVTHAAWPHLVAQRYGRIVSTTSNSGLLGIAGSSAYAASKAAIWGFTRSLALEAAPVGITVNAVAPIAYTAMAAASRIAPPAWRSGKGDAWSRRLDPAHVSATVAWLGHEDCTLNGQVLSTAGGRVSRFALHVTDGFDVQHLSVEDVRDHESLLLAEHVGHEYRTAAEEGRDLHRRLLPPAAPLRT